MFAVKFVAYETIWNPLDMLPSRTFRAGAEVRTESEVRRPAETVWTRADCRTSGVAADGDEHVLSFRTQHLHWIGVG